MYTYQELVNNSSTEKSKMQFIKKVIAEHRSSNIYKTAMIADDYDRHLNTTITNYQKLLYTVSGKAVPDNYSANYKLASNFFNRFITQEVQFLLGNGVTWQEDSTKEKLGEDFDMRLQEAGKKALVGGVSFGFWNYDHMEVFSINEFAPIYDEENGALMAGVRFWQVSAEKPLRATLYELDGVTEYKFDKQGDVVLKEKTTYIQKIQKTKADVITIYDGWNYDSFPIVPLWGNPHRQSEIVGLRTEIDAYDLIQSGFANDLDDASQIYWILENAGGMDDVDIASFLSRLKTSHGANLDDGIKATAHTLDVPYNAREAILTRLEKTMYKDAMALNVENISSGSATATEIKASYEPLNSKCDQFEMCLVEFLQGILKIADIDDSPTFTRSMIANAQEELQMVLQSAEYLPDEYITKKILSILGDADSFEDVMQMKSKEELDRFASNEVE